MHNLLAVTLGVIAALLQGAAYLIYAITAKLGKNSPKSATWGLWVLLVVLNCLTYGFAINNWIILLSFLTDSVACVMLFGYMLILRKLSWPKPKEWIVIGIAVLAMLAWWEFRNAGWANVIIFVALSVSIIPMYEGLYADPLEEKPLAWIVWTLAFFTSGLNVVVNWKGQWLTLIMPVGATILHAIVAQLSREERVKRFYFLDTLPIGTTILKRIIDREEWMMLDVKRSDLALRFLCAMKESCGVEAILGRAFDVDKSIHQSSIIAFPDPTLAGIYVRTVDFPKIEAFEKTSKFFIEAF